MLRAENTQEESHMKKTIALCLLLATLFSGCTGAVTIQQTDPVQVSAPQETQSPEREETQTEEILSEATEPAPQLPYEIPSETMENTAVELPNANEGEIPTNQPNTAETITQPNTTETTTQPNTTQTTPPIANTQTTTQTANNGALPDLPAELHLRVGQTYDFLKGYTGDATKLKWSTNVKTAVTVTQQGVINTVSAGGARISVTDGKTTRSCMVSAHEILIDIGYSSVYMQAGQSIQFEARYYGTQSKLTWYSQDPSVASVTQTGLVTAHKRGDIRVYLTDGIDTASCPVTVRETDNRLRITTEYPVFRGETLKLSYEYTGSDLRPLTWSSGDPSILTVDQTGRVTGVSIGKATVQVTDGDVSSKITVEVKDPANKTTGIYLHHRVNLYDGVVRFSGDSMQLLVGARPDRTVNVLVSSSNQSVVHAVLEPDPRYNSPDYLIYKLYFKNAGTAVVTFASRDGCVTEKYTVRVKSTYDCDPGKSKLTPDEFSYCATKVGVENGQKESTVLSGYRYLYLTDDELTWERAKAVGQSLAKEWYGISISRILVTYAGWDEERGMHLFYIGY